MGAQSREDSSTVRIRRSADQSANQTEANYLKAFEFFENGCEKTALQKAKRNLEDPDIFPFFRILNHILIIQTTSKDIEADEHLAAAEWTLTQPPYVNGEGAVHGVDVLREKLDSMHKFRSEQKLMKLAKEPAEIPEKISSQSSTTTNQTWDELEDELERMNSKGGGRVALKGRDEKEDKNKNGKSKSKAQKQKYTGKGKGKVQEFADHTAVDETDDTTPFEESSQGPVERCDSETVMSPGAKSFEHDQPSKPPGPHEPKSSYEHEACGKIGQETSSNETPEEIRAAWKTQWPDLSEQDLSALIAASGELDGLEHGNRGAEAGPSRSSPQIKRPEISEQNFNALLAAAGEDDNGAKAAPSKAEDGSGVMGGPEWEVVSMRKKNKGEGKVDAKSGGVGKTLRRGPRQRTDERRRKTSAMERMVGKVVILPRPEAMKFPTAAGEARRLNSAPATLSDEREFPALQEKTMAMQSRYRDGSNCEVGKVLLAKPEHSVSPAVTRVYGQKESMARNAVEYEREIPALQKFGAAENEVEAVIPTFERREHSTAMKKAGKEKKRVSFAASDEYDVPVLRGPATTTTTTVTTSTADTVTTTTTTTTTAVGGDESRKEIPIKEGAQRKELKGILRNSDGRVSDERDSFREKEVQVEEESETSDSNEDDSGFYLEYTQLTDGELVLGNCGWRIRGDRTDGCRLIRQEIGFGGVRRIQEVGLPGRGGWWLGGGVFFGRGRGGGFWECG